MAYINVAEWTPDQVTDWLKGLDDSMYNYIYSFTNNEVGGQQLLNIRPYELEELGMHSIGHQEIVLEAVEHLRNFHYNLDKENLQFLALHVATAARSLYKQLAYYCDKSKIETQILNDITRTIATIKPVISWLDRAPFQGQLQFNEIRKNMLRLGLEMATSAQRDRFVENPVDQIRMTAEKLAKLADYIIQDISDPMLLQPASLNLVTLKKRESELGFNIVPSFHGVHRVSDIKYNSPAHNSGKIEDGDEIVQINYQTVVGWQYKTVILQLRESPPDVLLTLKKRPKHTKIYGQIYMQPYRLPSKKRAPPGRWGDNQQQPSPRAKFLAVQDFTLPLKMNEKHTTASDTDSSCSDILTPTDPKSVDKEIRLYLPKPRAVLQRRNTICGDELSYLKNSGNIPLWHERKSRQNGEATSPSLRDKSVSFGFGLEIAPRPTTCLGIGANGGKLTDLVQLNNLLPEINSEQEKTKSDKINCSDGSESPKPGVSKVVRFDANMKYEDYPIDNEYTCNIDNTILETFEPIPYVDDEDVPSCREIRVTSKKSDIPENNNAATTKISTFSEQIGNQSQSQIQVQAQVHSQQQQQPQPKLSISSVTSTRRGRLDKSHSTPAYDNSGDDSDTPPAIEPRKDVTLTPPAPPPRPKRQSEIQPPAVPPPPPKPLNLCQSNESVKPPTLKVTLSSPLQSSVPASVHFLQESTVGSIEESELLTPTKTKNLTLKKKNSLLAKRRKISLKALGISDIQGHLYRRTKDRRGVTFWAKLYFVLIETVLYGFRNKEAQKANCMVILPGFTVSIAKEVHSKSFAFKVYHPIKTFYFAAESVEAMNQWMDFIRQATLSDQKSTTPVGSIGAAVAEIASEINTKELFSETDSSGDEGDSPLRQLPTSSLSPSDQTGFPFRENTQRTKESSSSSSSSKHDKYLSSLKIFSKTSLPFKSSGDKKSSSDVPVPTAQFRSYRKAPGGSYGLQIGTSLVPYHNENSPPNQTYSFTNEQINTNISNKKHSSSSVQNTVTCSTNSDHKILNSDFEYNHQPYQQHHHLLQQHHHHYQHEDSSSHFFEDKPKKIRRTSPYNYIHASNPNLVEFDFQTSKSLDFSLPKINSSNSWDAHNNLGGFVTLKDLMLQKQKEEAQEMYNNRVFLGVEKKDDRNLKSTITSATMNTRNKNRHDEGGNSSGKEKVSKIQSRSLPKTPDYEMSFKPDDEDIKRTRTKEGLKLRDFGYEFIYGDEPINVDTIAGSEIKSSSTSTSNNQQITSTSGNQNQTSIPSKKKHSTSSCSDSINDKSNAGGNASSSSGYGGSISSNSGRGGSFKKHKGKFDAFKSSSEKLFQFKHSHSESASLKSSTAYTPLTLPLNKKSTQLYIQLDSNCSLQTTTNLKKSNTYFSSDSKKFEAPRKNSAPVPIFSKFSFSSNNNKTGKERKLLGSPRLHRAIFGGRGGATGTNISTQVTSSRSHTDLEHEIFSPIIFPKISTQSTQQISTISTRNSSTDLSVSQTVTITAEINQQPSIVSSIHHQTPEYPNMECPPVFEPETYSLSDPNASLTLLRRRKNLEEN